MKQPVFVISLDFELIWGVLTRLKNNPSYLKNIRNTPEVIRKTLELFSAYSIHASWATVGFLFAEDQDDLTNHFSEGTINLLKKNHNFFYLSEYVKEYGEKACFAPELISQIKTAPGQEIASHTFSHYYTRETGRSLDSFLLDIKAAKKIAKSKGVSFKSIVFPRNQINIKYLPHLAKEGFIAYRGNEPGWMFPSAGYRIYNSGNFSKIMRLPKRGARLLDSYVVLGNKRTHDPEDLYYVDSLINVQGSHFFRPFSERLKHLNKWRINRIKTSMTYAAKNNELFHLWWHPHNFGNNIQENLHALTEVLKHYQQLQQGFGMRSYNIQEAAKYLSSYLHK